MEHNKRKKSSIIYETEEKSHFNIALIGGIDRLKKHYINEAGKYNVKLKVYNMTEAGIGAKIQNSDAVVIFTNKISHSFKMEVMNAVKSRKIPVYMSHSCGICSLRNCMDCIFNYRV